MATWLDVKEYELARPDVLAAEVQLCSALLCLANARPPPRAGADTLLQLLKNFSRAGNKKMAITVGVVGACS